jgi:acetyl-CoA carboxylase biotin carboxyl carrier protein
VAVTGDASGELDPALAVEQVLATVRGTSITELEVDWGDGTLRLAREAPAAIDQLAAEAADQSPSAEITITSTNVGIVHCSPADRFPAVGDSVARGALLAEVETLGVRNSVSAMRAGVVVELLVEDGAPVEYGQPLLAVRPIAELAGASDT